MTTLAQKQEVSIRDASRLKESANNAQVIYISHGGGPLPILGEVSHEAMNRFMRRLPSLIKKPEAIVVISAHWECGIPTVLSAQNPTMLYDYYGFPAEAYELDYPACGSPELASKITRMLKKRDVESATEEKRGFDHGLYIPLLLMYPEADIPAVQISLKKGLRAKEHIKLGKALRQLMSENILIIGSGFSFHNMSAFSFEEADIDYKNDEFQDWLKETVAGDLPAEERIRRLENWTKAPNARYCHPREEHLLPLHVCYGISGGRGEVIFDDKIAGKRSLAFLWE